MAPHPSSCFVPPLGSVNMLQRKKHGPSVRPPLSDGDGAKSGASLHPQIPQFRQDASGAVVSDPADSETDHPRDTLRIASERRLGSSYKSKAFPSQPENEQKPEIPEEHADAGSSRLLGRIWRLASSMTALQAQHDRAEADLAERDSQISVLIKLLTLWDPSPTAQATNSTLRGSSPKANGGQDSSPRVTAAGEPVEPSSQVVDQSATHTKHSRLLLPALPPQLPDGMTPLIRSAIAPAPSSNLRKQSTPRSSILSTPIAAHAFAAAAADKPVAGSPPTLTSMRQASLMSDLKSFIPVAKFRVVPQRKEFSWRHKSQRHGHLAKPLQELIWQNTIVQRDALGETESQTSERSDKDKAKRRARLRRTSFTGLIKSQSNPTPKDRDVEAGREGLSQAGAERGRRRSSVSSDGVLAVVRSGVQLIRQVSKSGGAEDKRNTAWASLSSKVSFYFRGNKDKDGAEEEARPSFLPLYRRIFRVVMTALFDVVALLVFRVFWHDVDPTCHVRHDDDGETRAVPNDAFVSLITVIHFLHLLDVWVRMSDKDANRRRMMFRIFYSARAPNSSVKAVINSLEALTLFLMASFVWIHRGLCHLLVDEDEQPEIRVLQRVDLLLHAIRCMQALQRCWMLHSELQKRIQTLVSLNKRRFLDQDQSLDLDLTYICDRVIAMAVPCVDHALHRNDIREVSRFFATRHYGKFLVFNLCEEHEEKGNGNYDVKLLYGQVEKLPFLDHNAPRLHVIVNFCEQATAWLNESPENVVAVHCRGGKGRTGTMTSSLLLWTKFRDTAAEALETFAERRTLTYRTRAEMQRVSSPSQLRYVGYLEQIMTRGVDDVSRRWRIVSGVTLHTTPMLNKDALRVLLYVENGSEVVYDHAKAHGVKQIRRREADGARDSWSFEIGEVLVSGDVTIRLFFFDDDVRGVEDHQAPVFLPGRRSVKFGSGTARQLCFVTFHTSFHDDDSLFFPKADVDGAYDKPTSQFLDTFAMTVDFAHLDVDQHRHPVSHRQRSRRRHSDGNSDAPTSVTVGTEHDEPDGLERATSRLDAVGFGRTDSGGTQHEEVQLRFGLSAVQRFVHVHETTRQIMREACPELWEFRMGDVVFNPQILPVTNARTLYYVVQGNVRWSLSADTAAPTKIGFGWSLRGTGLGAGEFFGVLQFLLDDFQDQHAVLVANTDTVLVRRIELPYEEMSLTAPDDQHPTLPRIPVTLPGCTTTSSATVFELLAKQTARRAHDMIKGGQQTNTIISNVKSDVNVSSRETERRHTAAKIVRRHNMSLEEHLRDAAPVRFSFCGKTGSRSKEIKGTVYVFRTFMAFSSVKLWYNQRKEVVIPFQTVQNTGLDGATVKVHLTDEMAASIRRSSMVGEEPERRGEEPSPLQTMKSFRKLTSKNFLGRQESRLSADEGDDAERHVSLVFKDPSAANRIRHNIAQRVAAIADESRDSSPHSKSRSLQAHTRPESPESPPQHSSPPGSLATHFSRRGSPHAQSPPMHVGWVNRQQNSRSPSPCRSPRARVPGERRDSDTSKFSAFSVDEALHNFSRTFGFVLADEVVHPTEEVALEGLFSKSKVSRYHDKEVILKQGSTERLLFHIVSGNVRVLADGMLVATLSEGNVFGEVSFLETGNFGARSDVVADGDVEVVVISHDSIEILAALQPSIGARFYRSLAVSSAKRLQKQYAEMFRRVSLLAEGSAKHHQTYTVE